jgi:hypothetical protein
MPKIEKDYLNIASFNGYMVMLICGVIKLCALHYIKQCESQLQSKTINFHIFFIRQMLGCLLNF